MHCQASEPAAQWVSLLIALEVHAAVGRFSEGHRVCSFMFDSAQLHTSPCSVTASRTLGVSTCSPRSRCSEERTTSTTSFKAPSLHESSKHLRSLFFIRAAGHLWISSSNTSVSPLKTPL
jgi:hypothetical protein